MLEYYKVDVTLHTEAKPEQAIVNLGVFGKKINRFFVYSCFFSASSEGAVKVIGFVTLTEKE